MADIIKKATNKFTKGLVMDFSPENTKNEVLTHALNATLLTFNGNELSLQNDMGNARVETAYLPEGYMPVGACEYGGIIYIVSYNPLENKSQIGCFPSPERNISNDELGEVIQSPITKGDFQEMDGDNPNGTLKQFSKLVTLREDNLNPGDKFLVCADECLYEESLADLLVKNDGKYELVPNPIISLNIVSIEDSGKITYLNSDVLQYENEKGGNEYKYHILGEMNDEVGFDQIDIDSYRNTVSSGYSVFKSKTSGKLAILAELVTIDSYSVTHSLYPKKTSGGETIDGNFDVIIHTEVEPQLPTNSYNILPKLRYYYLENSQGYLQAISTTQNGQNSESQSTYNSQVMLFDDNNVVNGDFLSTKLSQVFVPITQNSSELNGTLGQTGKFNFPKPKSYHGRMENSNLDDYEFTKLYEDSFHRISKQQIVGDLNNPDYSLYDNYYSSYLQAKFYRYNANNTYIKFEGGELQSNYAYYVLDSKEEYVDAKRNTIHRSKTLYKLVSKPAVATEKEIKDPSIQKYENQSINIYKVATQEEIDSGQEELWEKTGDQYTTTVNPIPGKTYYILKVKNQFSEIKHEDINIETLLGELYYYPIAKDYEEATQEDLDIYWNFVAYPSACPIELYYIHKTETYVEATEEQKNNYKELNIELYYKAIYLPVDLRTYNPSNGQLFIVVPMDSYISRDKFVPNVTDNYISGVNTPNTYDGESPITLHTVADFIPTQLTQNSDTADYSDVKLANIQIPKLVHSNGIDLPFKYDYTLVPCMNFGRLDSLAVSNTVDFSKLHAFNQSNFNTWKYHIDGSDLRLTFGADVYDTYEDKKVDALVLEFYDLWGFAGSLEITGKKSYSGKFTKLISLNQFNALSKKRVSGNTYSDTFRRNVNIVDHINSESNSVSYIFNNKEVYYSGSDGWRYLEDSSGIEDSNNDCGVLYSNILYGVKTYMRIPDNDGNYTFIPKKQFFLYTLPILNDYYYSCDDFSTLQNPKLDVMMTFKILDSSKIEPYNNDSIIDGYTEAHKSLVDSYVGGVYDKSSMEVCKYMKYKGQSKLFLEVGLVKEYSSLNLNYDVSINDYFSCDLQLQGSKDLYDVKFDDSQFATELDAFNYETDSLDKATVNKIGFGDNFDTKISLNNTAFKNTNFIHYKGSQPVNINYEFVVGYKASVMDIRNTEVQATTVCALCHKDSEGNYNYTDFGIYAGTAGDNTLYLSDRVFFNSGSAETSIFGICQQVAISGNAGEVLNQQDSLETTTSKLINAGELNKGEPLKAMSQHIGTLAFCTPHAHAIDLDYGVSVQAIAKVCLPDKDCGECEGYVSTYKHPEYWSQDTMCLLTAGVGNSDTRKIYKEFAKCTGRPSGANNVAEDTCGTLPGLILFHQPRFTMALNTISSLKYYSKFISTMDYYVPKVNMEAEYANTSHNGIGLATIGEHYDSRRQYTGINPSDLEHFNKCLLETMKSVYAYNPDYDSLLVKAGDVIVQKNPITFGSNVISTKSELALPEDKSFNDFIYIGPILFSNYIKYMQNFSEYQSTVIKTYDENNKPLPQVAFAANLRYCGTPDSYYLVTQLNYNTDTPQVFEDELSYKRTDEISVKHHDGKVERIVGIPDKKALYGFDHNKKLLIQLDVSNYKIDQNTGKLTLTSKYDYVFDRLGNMATDEKVGSYNDQLTYVPGLNADGSTTQPNEDSQIVTTQVISTKQTKEYASIVNDAYRVSGTFKNSCLVNSSLTLNDLEYYPNDTHRLFAKDTCYKYITSKTPILFYRPYGYDSNNEDCVDPQWNYDKYGSYNWLSLYTGPCFTKYTQY